MDSTFGLRFWGTRGLVSSPGLQNAGHGGNTSCIQIIHRDKTIIVDTGFGVTNLGEILLKDQAWAQSAEVHIFFTHFHWDHIQGLPFFAPIYFPTTTMHLYSPSPPEAMLDNLDLLFDGSYSPFSGIKSMPANIQFHQLKGSLDMQGLDVKFQELDHGDHDPESKHDQTSTYAYRFQYGGNSITIATDHEAKPSAINTKLVKFASDTDILVHDAQYSEDEYLSHHGWGHSSFTQALDNAVASRCRSCLLTHHDPKRTDEQLLFHLKRLYRCDTYKNLQFDFARENEDFLCSDLATHSTKVAG